MEESLFDEQETDLLDKLARTVSKFFYKPKEILLLDMIIREKRVSEKRLEEKLKYDIMLLRVTLDTLRNDKIIGMDVVTEERMGRLYRDSYFFVKYESLVDVVKYKLEHVRKSLEFLERDWNIQKSFVCTPCGKKWNDLEAGEILNPKPLKLSCMLCKGPVTEDISEIPRDTRLQIAKFNEQTGVIYDLIKEIEDHFDTNV